MILAEVIGTVCGATAPILGYGYWTWTYYAPKARRYFAKRALRRTKVKLAKLEEKAARAQTKILPEEDFKSEADVVRDLDTALREVSDYDPAPTPYRGVEKLRTNPKRRRKEAKAKRLEERAGTMPNEPFVAGPEEVHGAETAEDFPLPQKVNIMGVVWRSMQRVNRVWTCAGCEKMIMPNDRAYRGVKGKEHRQRMCVLCACSKGKEVK